MRSIRFVQLSTTIFLCANFRMVLNCTHQLNHYHQISLKYQTVKWRAQLSPINEHSTMKGPNIFLLLMLSLYTLKKVSYFSISRFNRIYINLVERSNNYMDSRTESLINGSRWMQINYESYVAVALYSITQAALAYSLMWIFHEQRAIDDSNWIC